MRVFFSIFKFGWEKRLFDQSFKSFLLRRRCSFKNVVKEENLLLISTSAYKLQHADKKNLNRVKSFLSSSIIVLVWRKLFIHFPQLNNSIRNSKHAWKEIPWRKSKSNYDMQVEQTTSLSCRKCRLYWKRCFQVHWIVDEEVFFNTCIKKKRGKEALVGRIYSSFSAFMLPVFITKNLIRTGTSAQGNDVGAEYKKITPVLKCFLVFYDIMFKWTRSRQHQQDEKYANGNNMEVVKRIGINLGTVFWLSLASFHFFSLLWQPETAM